MIYREEEKAAHLQSEAAGRSSSFITAVCDGLSADRLICHLSLGRLLLPPAVSKSNEDEFQRTLLQLSYRQIKQNVKSSCTEVDFSNSNVFTKLSPNIPG